MNELERVLIGNSVAAPPSHILEEVDEEFARRRVPGVPHSIYEELWHLAFWQEIALDWIAGKKTAYPERASLGFPAASDVEGEGWSKLSLRFFAGLERAAAIAGNAEMLDRMICCPSVAGKPDRTMTVREQVESLGAHNAYHLGRIVLLRQLGDAWPPASGGDTW